MKIVDLYLGEQITVEEVRGAIKDAIDMEPELQVLRVKNSDLLNNETLTVIEEMASQGDFQVWLERQAVR